MAEKNENTHLEPIMEEMMSLDEAKKFVENAEKRGYVIKRPQNPHNLRVIIQAVHALVTDRLIAARNQSKLNNDKINRMMVDQYMLRKRRGKAWTFTNAISPRTSYFPDEEEVEMLAKILNVSSENIGIHLNLVPWIIDDQNARREVRNKTRTTSRRLKSADKNVHNCTVNTGTNTVSQEKYFAKKSNPVQSERMQNIEAINVSDIKISHNGGNIRVHGKIWCTLDVAQKLRMIVPLKLINQAKGNEPWCYDINGPVHAYQLYNLMHVIYGAPRVTAVQMD